MHSDLFGQPAAEPDDPIAQMLLEQDRLTIEERVRRLKLLAAIAPDSGFVMSVETAIVFGEARSTYVNGDFAASLLVSQSFIEHRLQGYLEFRGQAKVAKAGLAAIVAHLRTRKVVHDSLLERIDRLRRIRNPFTHLRHGRDPHALARRSVERRQSFEDLMEHDAYEALAVMFTAAVIRLPGE